MSRLMNLTGLGTRDSGLERRQADRGISRVALTFATALVVSVLGSGPIASIAATGRKTGSPR